MRARLLLAPVALLLTSGCLASKGDIRLLQDDLTSMQAQQAHQATLQEQTRARADSLARVRLDSAIVALGAIHDSLRALSERFTSYQANSSQAMYEVGQQLITLQNRAGISQRQIQDLAAQLDTQHARLSGDSTSAKDTSAANQAPGPAQLFVLGRNQYNNGAFSTARTAFQALLKQYPNYFGAATTANYIALTYDAEGNGAAADSAYQSVVAQYPQSEEAPTALYKHALWLLKSGKPDDARAALQRVVKDYPGTTAAGLAADRLKSMPAP
ncbi:MAG: tetratricopeptide repeat protein [Gemmatimonadaceae bacterium]|nr:tetratricopeptide repeat protein [Gemmatimonadaceae bacterium]